MARLYYDYNIVLVVHKAFRGANDGILVAHSQLFSRYWCDYSEFYLRG